MPNPYDKTTHDGKPVDWLTHCALLECEIRLGYRLTIVQGSYHAGVSASAGTHDGGGVIDLLPWDWTNKVRVARSIGFAMWHRLPSQGPWAEHCHGVLVGNTKLSPAAGRQVTSYFNGRNGLANAAADDFKRPAVIPTYMWPGSDAALALEARAARLLDKPVAPPAKPPGKPPERIAVDYSFARPHPGAMKAAGIRGVIRYISPGSKKDLTRTEATALHTAGLWIALVWESTAGRAANGTAAGITDVARAEAAADALGAPTTSVIFYAVDFDATPAQVRDYFAAVRAHARRPVGIYGSFRIIEADLAPWKWQTAAWSHRQISGKANWLQRTTHSRNITGSKSSDWDENLLIGGNVPVWRPSDTPAPAPVPSNSLTWVARHANVQGTDPLHSVTVTIAGLLAGASIVRLNELHTAAQRTYVTTRPGWGARVVGQLAIMWDAAIWAESAWDYEKANGGVAHITPERGILNVRLTHLASGVTHWEQATHVVHHIDVGGRARVAGALAGQNLRARHHFGLLAASIASHAAQAPLTGSGDLNVDYIAEKHLAPARRTPWFPLTVLGAVAVLVMPRKGPVYVGTHGGRAIDWGWRRGPIRVTRCTTLPRGTSDHNPVEYTVSQP